MIIVGISALLFSTFFLSPEARDRQVYNGDMQGSSGHAVLQRSRRGNLIRQDILSGDVNERKSLGAKSGSLYSMTDKTAVVNPVATVVVLISFDGLNNSIQQAETIVLTSNYYINRETFLSARTTL